MTENTNFEDKINEFGKRELGEVKVMMVEDDPFISELVMTKLSLVGCVPYSVLDGNDIINTASQFQPDVIILDLMLPGIQGEEIIAKLKENEDLKHIYILVFSNKSDESEIKKCLELGAAEYFVKASTDLNLLVDAIKRLTLQPEVLAKG